MDVENLPLLDLFTRLRKAGLPLGVDEYLLILRALQAGFGISDWTDLKRLCRTLWTKSVDEGHLLDYYFEQLMHQPAESELSSQQLDSSMSHTTSESVFGKRSLLNTLFGFLGRLSRPFHTHPERTALDAHSSTTMSEMMAASEIILHIEDEVYIAQAVLQVVSNDEELSPGRFISSDEYFPVTRRQMKQSFRYLRRPVREGPPMELDVEATAIEVVRKGMLLEPILVPRRINRAEILLLIDHGGSMIPFHMLSDRLIETVLRGGRLGKASIYYFHNCPVEYLYRDLAHQEYERIEELLNRRFSQQAGVLVFSDAGTARGGFSQERIDLTKVFLERLKQRFRSIVWLNPMPRSRWYGTTAGQIMQNIPMFDLSRRGLDDAISVLGGHSSHGEVLMR